MHAGEITVTSGDDTYYTLSDPATLTVKNRPYTLTVHKQDRDTSDPLAAEFALYKQGKVDGVTVYSIPDDSYSSLSTDASGDIVINTAILAPGTYQLREKTAPGGYLSILEDAIVLIVSNTGYVTLSREDPSYLSNRIATETDAKTCEYTLTVQNQRQMPSPTGLTISIVPFIVLVGSGLLLTPICLAGKKRGRHEAR